MIETYNAEVRRVAHEEYGQQRANETMSRYRTVIAWEDESGKHYATFWDLKENRDAWPKDVKTHMVYRPQKKR